MNENRFGMGKYLFNYTTHPDFLGERYTYKFPNGFGASVIKDVEKGKESDEWKVYLFTHEGNVFKLAKSMFDNSKVVFRVVSEKAIPDILERIKNFEKDSYPIAI